VTRPWSATSFDQGVCMRSAALWRGVEAQHVFATMQLADRMDSDALTGQALHTEHTFFKARVRGRCVDLTAPPWNAAARAWGHGTDYSACQALAGEARKRELAWIRYASVRVPKGVCGAALMADALSLVETFERQAWACKTTRTGAYLQRSGHAERLEFSSSGWG